MNRSHLNHLHKAHYKKGSANIRKAAHYAKFLYTSPANNWSLSNRLENHRLTLI